MTTVHTYYGPDTPEEEYLKWKLSELQESYQRAAQPIIDELVQIQARKLPRIIVFEGEPPAGWEP